MLFLLMIALLATIAFYRRSRQMGLDTGRLASVPFVTLGILMVLGHITARLITASCQAMQVAEDTTRLILLVMQCFGLLAYAVIIRSYWAAMK